MLLLLLLLFVAFVFAVLPLFALLAAFVARIIVFSDGSCTCSSPRLKLAATTMAKLATATAQLASQPASPANRLC